MNTFFKHKTIQQYTWNARGQSPIIDYFILNRKTAVVFLEVRAYTGADIHSDHYLAIKTINIKARWVEINKAESDKTEWKVYLLQEESV